MRRAARTDHNQALIVDALRRAGASVEVMSSRGEGVPDLLVGYLATCAKCGTQTLACVPMEVKNPDQSPSKRRLTPAERVWHEQWRGPLVTVLTVEEALAAIGVEVES